MGDMRKDHEEEDKERSVSFKSHLKKQLHLNESRGGLVFLPYPSLAPGRTSFLAASDLMMMILGILLLSFFLTAKFALCD
jgi:hypothetical protein